MLLLMNYFMMRPNDKLTNDKIDLKTTAAHRTMIDRKWKIKAMRYSVRDGIRLKQNAFCLDDVI